MYVYVYSTFKANSDKKAIVMSHCDAQLIYLKMHLALAITSGGAVEEVLVMPVVAESTAISIVIQ